MRFVSRPASWLASSRHTVLPNLVAKVENLVRLDEYSLIYGVLITKLKGVCVERLLVERSPGGAIFAEVAGVADRVDAPDAL